MKASDVARNIERQYTHRLGAIRIWQDPVCRVPTIQIIWCCSARVVAEIAPIVLALLEMNATYLTEKAVRLMEERPEVSLCYENFNGNETNSRTSYRHGLRVEINYYAKHIPNSQAPWKDDYDATEEEIRTGTGEFEQDLNDYTEECKKSVLEVKQVKSSFISVLREQGHRTLLCSKVTFIRTTNGTKQKQTLSR